ncbi:16S rRNA (guanine(527)-N(7))-methyltransferase RsmG [Paenisporosarcina cavernae]|uniref:Ribosomal RNA small subunit methyltransferase G n=1 Tax=Paenisporosarcina cavernae TaxID=2320858 RepID=A0A385YRN1_9BACL|nr:16S rRNA (guanine(527)-N(7))-methyltransferase RsmG [Paenisporosarcina cavernae]AYC28382.1 16S rRNA (guanine(527)-N(7))-methyltransferase RsmG [Paenisporosarcina cavernae]
MNEDLFVQTLAEKGIILSDTQIGQFKRYYELLVEWNEKMNLTAITELKEVYLKHFYDSISLAFYSNLSDVKTVCDVGAGAGFPSIPLKICFPHLHITIVDSLNKRITFLENLSKELQLSDTHFVHSRAEDFGQEGTYREMFDLVTARAVARLSVLAELCVPLVKKGGQFIALKAANAKDEFEQAEKALTTLGVELDTVHHFQLPIEESDRTIFLLNKVKATPKKYPRKAGVPNKSPIQ